MTRVSGLGLLDRLPNELLEHIRKCIGYDLEGQVSFLKLSPHTATFFDTLPTAFWQNLCRHNGFGAIKVQEAADEVCWRDIALECVEHAWSCEHPACGRDRLREIRECWNRNPLTSSWDRARTATPADDLSHGFLTSGLNAISIYTSLNLTTSEHASYPFLCSPDHPNTDELTAKRHPLFLHSFATFPPCEQMQITSPDVGACDVRNEQGCTVGDVLDALISLCVPLS
ncbi:hypothetical protein PHLGIDRAFT_267506 [Phlebiopsis gigantea 11061_1 CR5-6]|uniref:DUF6699 domain-containing protein n=1 Tax=Phlebiopsis gigantea (strain 11061_1 CR5-6) TaxID=745531 RepID=A0A0C3S1C4_PHLG1|nr:hypothetical protein PHLGIDRAFT_267506 [Phlebiopsis gigantea 11061_1 CR5-6]